MRGFTVGFRCLVFSIAGLAFLTSSCTVSLVRFEAPAVVQAGAVFDVVIAGTGTNGVSSDLVGAVLQAPFGFVVEEITSVGGMPTFSPSPAAFTSLFSPEGGHALIFASAGVTPTATSAALRVRLRAPRTPGVYTLKCALAATSNTGVWSVNAPAASGGNFAAITSPSFARTVTVTAGSSGLPTWRSKSSGLVPVFSTNYSQFDYDVAVGDFDGDGRTDFVAGLPQPTSVIGGVALPPRLHNGRVVEGWTLSQPFGTFVLSRGAASGDFNADGIDDLMLDNRPHLGQAGGGFIVMPNLPIGAAQSMVATADFDLDGDDDVAVCDGAPRVYLSAGGIMTLASAGLPTTGGPDVVDLLAPDLEGDGDFDLVVVRLSGVTIHRNLGGSTWTTGPSPAPPPASQFPYFGTAGDIDGDGDQDIIVGINGFQSASGYSQAYSTTLRLLRNDGATWTNVSLAGLPTAEDYSAALLADIDGDGAKDIVAARSLDGINTGVWGRVEIWRNLGGFAVARSAALETGLEVGGLGNIFTILHRDVDDDGVADLVLNGAYGPSVYARSGLAQSATLSRVGQNLGQSIDLLTVNGSVGDTVSQSVALGLSQPIAIALAQAPFTAFPSRFVLFGKIGWPRESDALTTIIGALPFAPSSIQPGDPGLFTLANSFAFDATSVFPFVAPGAFSFTLSAGVSVPVVFSLGALIDDPASPPFAIGITNTVIVDVR